MTAVFKENVISPAQTITAFWWSPVVSAYTASTEQKSWQSRTQRPWWRRTLREPRDLANQNTRVKERKCRLTETSRRQTRSFDTGLYSDDLNLLKIAIWLSNIAQNLIFKKKKLTKFFFFQKIACQKIVQNLTFVN